MYSPDRQAFSAPPLAVHKNRHVDHEGAERTMHEFGGKRRRSLWILSRKVPQSDGGALIKRRGDSENEGGQHGSEEKYVQDVGLVGRYAEADGQI